MVWIRRNLNLIMSYGSCNTIMHTISSLLHTKFFSSTGATVAIARVCDHSSRASCHWHHNLL